MARRRARRAPAFKPPTLSPLLRVAARCLPTMVAGSTPLIILAAGFFLAGRAEPFRVKEVRWPSGATLRQATPSLTGVPIFAVDLQELQRRLEAANPGFQQMRVSRLLPSTLVVETWERHPVAQVRLGNYYPVDVHGFILKEGNTKPIEQLPLLQGVEGGGRLVPGQSARSQRLQAGLKLCERLSRERLLSGHVLSSLDVADTERLSCVLDGTINTKLGSLGGLDQALPRLQMVLSSVNAQQMGRLKSIDVRFTDPVIVPE
ncbi:MAG: FtsQ-type POTRA domain-containing protein [Candidatus Omnitrophica bacterium]|nr:FtsQ-type POTRA domain-containing protein [Candidatus Omnitrophota bacterium]